MADTRKHLDKGIAYLKRNGLKKTLFRAARKVHLARAVDYEVWLGSHSASDKELRRQREEEHPDAPSVKPVIFQTESGYCDLTGQTYQRICANDTSKDAAYTLLLEGETQLRPEAVYELVKAAQKQPEADGFYCDHDVQLLDGRLAQPFFKPEQDEVLLGQMNYMGTVLLLRTQCWEALSRERDPQSVWEAEERLLAAECRLARIALPLYHVTQKQQERLLTEKKKRTDSPNPGLKISVIIPNKDHIRDLTVCVESLLQDGGWENLEVLIVENGSTGEETAAGYQKLTMDPRVRILLWEEAFNYSAINNFAADQASGDYLLFLNNDTKVKCPGCIREMLMQCMGERVGAVGARLVYADGTIQHAGVVLGYGGIAGHAFEGMKDTEYEKTWYATVVRRMAAVTAACMLVKKAAFDEAGGFTEELGVAYNDIDLCMKLSRAGWQILYDPFAQLYHYESQTRGLELSAEKAQRVRREADLFVRTWKEELDRGDLFYHPNLTLEKADFSLKR